MKKLLLVFACSVVAFLAFAIVLRLALLQFGKSLRHLHYVAVDAPQLPADRGAVQGNLQLADSLNQIREKYHIPALGGALVTESGVKSLAMTGVRKRSTTVPATIHDQWHLGSDTKAMTATLLAILVEQKKLDWSSTVASVFPEIHFDPQSGSITLLQLLSHRSGLKPNTEWRAIERAGGSLPAQRLKSVEAITTTKLLAVPGASYAYSNWGYVVAGAMAERVTGSSYEALMRTSVFAPLKMTTAAFGFAGTSGAIDQPYGHALNGAAVQADNADVMAPAGGVHCSLDDWAAFIADHMKGTEGRGILLPPEAYRKLRTPVGGGNYALGWLVADRPWAGGSALTHSGSNTLNYAIVWIVPLRGFAAIIVCNDGDGARACDEAATALIRSQRQ